MPLTLDSCLLFFVGQPSKPLDPASFLEKIFPHPTQMWFCPHRCPHSSSIRLLFHHLPPLHICQWFFSFCLQVFIETLLMQVGRMCFISFIHHCRRQLPIAEGLFVALFVTTKQGLWRNAHRAWYAGPLFLLFMLRTLSKQRKKKKKERKKKKKKEKREEKKRKRKNKRKTTRKNTRKNTRYSARRRRKRRRRRRRRRKRKIRRKRKRKRTKKKEREKRERERERERERKREKES